MRSLVDGFGAPTSRSCRTNVHRPSAIGVDAGASWFAAYIIGMLTAIAGGITRDVLAREIPLVMGPDDLYAIPVMLGAATYVAIDYSGRNGWTWQSAAHSRRWFGWWRWPSIGGYRRVPGN